MADRGWDRETFYTYKQRPWVNRQGAAGGDESKTVAHDGDVLVTFLSMADAILGDMSELQRLLVQESVDKAEVVMGEVARKAKALHDLGVRLRARVPRLHADELSVLDKVYDSIARILNDRRGNILDVAAALAEAKARLQRGSSCD